MPTEIRTKTRVYLRGIHPYRYEYAADLSSLSCLPHLGFVLFFQSWASCCCRLLFIQWTSCLSFCSSSSACFLPSSCLFFNIHLSVTSAASPLPPFVIYTFSFCYYASVIAGFLFGNASALGLALGDSYNNAPIGMSIAVSTIFLHIFMKTYVLSWIALGCYWLGIRFSPFVLQTLFVHQISVPLFLLYIFSTYAADYYVLGVGLCSKRRSGAASCFAGGRLSPTPADLCKLQFYFHEL